MTEPQRLHPDSLACPTCQRPWPSTFPEPLTDRELDALSAWWHTRSVQQTAVLLGVGEQRAKNLLASARRRSGVQTNLELVSRHAAEIRSMGQLGSHNANRTAVLSTETDLGHAQARSG